MPFCRKCGEQIVGGALFCVKCGTPVYSRETDQPKKKNQPEKTEKDNNRVDYESLPEGYVLKDRYVVVKKLDASYYRAVYRVLDKENEQIRIVRFLPDSLINDKRVLFELRQEAQIMMPLNHPNILQVLDFQQSSSYSFITVENFEGKTLREILLTQDEGSLSEQEVEGYIEQIIAGMSYAHKKGVLHKALTLDSIYKTTEGTIKIADFGIARTIQLSINRLRDNGYSKVYDSPEQLRGEITARTVDVYSFGIIIYELLSGNPPFSAQDGNVFQQIMNIEPDPLSDVCESLNKFIAKCLEKEADKRYQDFIEVLERWQKIKQMQESGSENQDDEAEEDTAGLSYLPRAGRLTLRFIAAKVIKLVLLLIILFAVTLGINWVLDFREDYIMNNIELAEENMELLDYEAAKNHYKRVLLINRNNSIAQDGLIKAIDNIGQLKIDDPDMIFVKGGSFMMGSEDREEDEKPVHKVTLSDYYISKNLVTQSEWMDVMGNNPSQFQGGNLPVENVSWYHALVFCNKLSIKEGLTPVYVINRSRNPDDWGNVPLASNTDWDAVRTNWSADGYRLPTEAEWEYAARGGNKSKGYAYAGSDNIEEVAWYLNNSRRMTRPVAGKIPNELGLYDMSGNVWEWCWDLYGEYFSSELVDPKGSKSGNRSTLRGGSWDNGAEFCRTTTRRSDFPGYRYPNIGFRYVRRLK